MARILRPERGDFWPAVSCFFSLPFPSCPFLSEIYLVHMLQLMNGFTFNFPILSFVFCFPGLFFKCACSVNQHHRYASCIFIYCTAMRLLEFTISFACRLHSLLLGFVLPSPIFLRSSCHASALQSTNNTQVITQRQQHINFLL